MTDRVLPAVRPASSVPAVYAHGLPLEDLIKQAKLYADLVVSAGMAPACYNNNPSALAVVLIRGAELGITFSEATTSLYAIKNVVSAFTKLLVYMFRRHGGHVQLLVWEPDRCRIKLTQRGKAPLEVEFTLAECKAAGWNMEPARDESGKLTGGQREKYTWRTMPRIMVRNRTYSNGIRAYAPEIEFANGMDEDAADYVEDGEFEGDEGADFIDKTVTPSGAPAERAVSGRAESEVEEAEWTEQGGAEVVVKRDREPLENTGFGFWNEANRVNFMAKTQSFIPDLADVLREMGVPSMDEWPWSANNTVYITRILEAGRKIGLTVEEIKTAVGAKVLADLCFDDHLLASDLAKLGNAADLKRKPAGE